jgi:thiamine pyrophosphate-dependent acetolactate synthase large subunit-like protein
VTPAADERLDRRAVVRALLADREQLVVVTGLGSPSYDVMAAGDHDLNYYLWGAMGSAATVGLGLAVAQPKRPVLVITGDGEQLMGLGALATIGVQGPANLTIAVLDNERYGETGMQHSHTAAGVRIDQVAAACGFAWTAEVSESAGVEDARRRLTAFEGPGLVAFKVAPTDLPRALPPIDAVFLKHRLRLALGFAPS